MGGMLETWEMIERMELMMVKRMQILEGLVVGWKLKATDSGNESWPIFSIALPVVLSANQLLKYHIGEDQQGEDRRGDVVEYIEARSM